MGKQIHFVEQDQLCGPEHVRVFGRLIIAFGDGSDNDPRPFAEVEQCRADEIADILNKEHGTGWRIELAKRVADHGCIQMTPCTGVDLNDAAAAVANAFGVPRRFLVAFDDLDGEFLPKIANGSFEQRGLSGSRRTHQVEGADVSGGEPSAIPFRQALIFREEFLFESDDSAGFGRMGMRMGMILPGIMAVFVSVRVSVVVIVAVIVRVMVRVMVRVDLDLAFRGEVNMPSGLQIRDEGSFVR